METLKETKEQLIADLIRLAFCRRYRGRRPYDALLYPGRRNGEKPVNRQRGRRIGGRGNG